MKEKITLVLVIHFLKRKKKKDNEIKEVSKISWFIDSMLPCEPSE